jgi:hypothetical protein
VSLSSYEFYHSIPDTNRLQSYTFQSCHCRAEHLHSHCKSHYAGHERVISYPLVADPRHRIRSLHV